MEASAVVHSFHGAIGRQLLQNGMSSKTSLQQVLVVERRPLFSIPNPKHIVMVSAKASVTSVAAHSDPENASTPLSKKFLQNSTFPNGFEELVLEVCNETDVAEVKLKVGDFEMHLKRNVDAPKVVAPIVSPTTAPPIPSEPMVGSAPESPPVTPQKSSSVATNHFKNASSARESKLAALEPSGSNAYVLVSSPTVGSFRSGRTIKGKKQPPSCKEGDLIKEGQIIGYLDQFGNELPVKSDVAGEVLKVLYMDGEAAGYGDPLVAVLPSFHGINK